MRNAALLLPAAVSALLVVWCGPVSALSISFVERPPDFEISASTDIPVAVVTTGPGLATVNATVPGVLGGTGTSMAIGLLDPGTGLLIDLVTVSVSQGTADSIGIVVSYQSTDSPPLLPPAGGLTASTLETGLVQNVLALLLPRQENGPLDLDVTARGAVESGVPQSAPEPGTLLLFGSTIAGLGLAARRWLTR